MAATGIPSTSTSTPDLVDVRQTGSTSFPLTVRVKKGLGLTGDLGMPCTAVACAKLSKRGGELIKDSTAVIRDCSGWMCCRSDNAVLSWTSDPTSGLRSLMWTLAGAAGMLGAKLGANGSGLGELNLDGDVHVIPALSTLVHPGKPARTAVARLGIKRSRPPPPST